MRKPSKTSDNLLVMAGKAYIAFELSTFIQTNRKVLILNLFTVNKRHIKGTLSLTHVNSCQILAVLLTGKHRELGLRLNNQAVSRDTYSEETDPAQSPEQARLSVHLPIVIFF